MCSGTRRCLPSLGMILLRTFDVWVLSNAEGPNTRRDGGQPGLHPLLNREVLDSAGQVTGVTAPHQVADLAGDLGLSLAHPVPVVGRSMVLDADGDPAVRSRFLAGAWQQQYARLIHCATSSASASCLQAGRQNLASAVTPGVSTWSMATSQLSCLHVPCDVSLVEDANRSVAVRHLGLGRRLDHAAVPAWRGGELRWTL
jgi:hypothetical protein